MEKVKVSFVIAVALLLVAGGYFFPIGNTIVQQVTSGVGSSAGATFSTQKIASMQVLLSTSTAFVIYNGDGSDRIIKSADVYLAQTTVAANVATTSSSITCATSSVATGFSTPAPPKILSQNLLNIGSGTTTNEGLFFASSSPGDAGVTGAAGTASTTVRRWASGSYLVCQVSNTAGNVLPPGTVGTISFSYNAQ